MMNVFESKFNPLVNVMVDVAEPGKLRLRAVLAVDEANVIEVESKTALPVKDRVLYGVVVPMPMFPDSVTTKLSVPT